MTEANSSAAAGAQSPASTAQEPGGATGGSQAGATPGASGTPQDTGDDPIFSSEFLAEARAADGEGGSQPAQPDAADSATGETGEGFDADSGLRTCVPENGEYNFAAVQPDLDWDDPITAEAARLLGTQLTEAGVPESALPALTQILNDSVDYAVTQALEEAGYSHFSNPWVRAQEFEKLRDVWGPDYEKRGAAIKQAAVANFSSDVLHKPLLATAAGLQALETYMAHQWGARGGMIPERTEGRTYGRNDTGSLEAEKTKLMQSEAYSQSFHRDHEKTHNRVREIIGILRG